MKAEELAKVDFRYDVEDILDRDFGGKLYTEEIAEISVKITEAHNADLAERDARLAVMTGALERLHEKAAHHVGDHSDIGLVDWAFTRDIAAKALSAAPKLLWLGKGRVRQFVHKTSIEMTHTSAPFYLKTKLDVPDSQQVTIYMLADQEEEDAQAQ